MKEKELEDNLEKNLDKIEPGLILVERQKRVDTGIIDLFCKDKKGKYVIVEIKRKPDTKVIVQLAKYHMALIKSGLNEKRLRTILVAPEISKSVQGACEFFRFEIKNIYKGTALTKKEEARNQLIMPNKEDLIGFIEKRNNLVNFSMIAKYFGIKNATVFDIISALEKEKIVAVQKLGSSKIVMVNKK